jgi:ribosomal protein L11
MRQRGTNKSITILGVVGKPVTTLAAAVASKGLKPVEVQKKITESSNGIQEGFPIVIKVLIKRGNSFSVNVRPGPTMDLVKHMQPDYKNQVKATTVEKIAKLYIKHAVANTSDEKKVIDNICNILYKSCKLSVEGYGGVSHE